MLIRLVEPAVVREPAKTLVGPGLRKRDNAELVMARLPIAPGAARVLPNSVPLDIPMGWAKAKAGAIAAEMSNVPPELIWMRELLEMEPPKPIARRPPLMVVTP